MSKTSRFGYVRLALLGWLGFTLAQGCSSALDDGGPTISSFGGSTFVSSGGRSLGEAGMQVIMPNLGAGTGGGGAANALCGVVSCVPDQSLRRPGSADPGCGVDAQSFELVGGAGGASNAAGGHDGVGGAAGAAGEGGTNMPAARGGATNAGGSSPGGGNANGSGGTFGSGGRNLTSAGEAGSAGLGAPTSACQVVWSDKSKRVTTTCGDSGAGELAAPCFTGADCKPGLACVTAGAISSCRPYCCLGQSSCDSTAGTYCAERPLVDASLPSGNAPKVPVCVPADHCDLSAPNTCPNGQACLVVRSDGATACAVPGTGDTGQACPCQAGKVCALSTSTCLGLCRLDATQAPTCAKGACQPSPQLPSGYGVCVAD